MYLVLKSHFISVKSRLSLSIRAIFATNVNQNATYVQKK